ncbi:MAG: zinc ribbon domain-containing protein [Bacteroidaceae bacterium]|nr:zinc ribbon domain-containing protein [Bacteroidaceae bacterium]
MYCPNCNQEYDGRFCPECRTPLIEKPAVANDIPGINLGDANAISGGLNVNVHREDNSQTTYHVEATKSAEQLLQENEERFLEAVQQRLSDGPLDSRKQAELELMALQCHISPARARDIIIQVRKSATAIQDELGNEFLAQQTLQEIINAVSHNQTDVLLRRLPALKQLAEKSAAANVQYYYHMLQASLTPEACTIDFLNAHTDNYWQLFWVHIAHIKMGHIDNATALLARLGGFGAPRGDIALLMAIDNLSDYLREGRQTYYKNQTEQYLDQAMDAGMSEPLNALWAATETLLQESPQPEEWFRYHVEHTLKELLPSKSSAATEKGAPQMPPMEMPPVPKFNAQNVNLAQMQGFNPLQAAQQMGIGMTAGMKKMECNISQMPGMNMVPPPIPSMEQVAPPPFPKKEGNSDM